MVLVGLTGGIGSGKSTVSAALAARGAVVIDADAITRELQEPGQPVFEQMVAAFGDAIVDPDGRLDRAAVADIVFRDPAEKARLEAIVHPEVGRVIAERLAAAADSSGPVILDVPLLVETGRDDLAATIVVEVDPEVAVERLVAQRGFREEDARNRIANQATNEQRRAVADLLIDNNGTRAELEAQIERCWEWLAGLEASASR